MAIEIGGKMYVTVAERLQAVHAENVRFEVVESAPYEIAGRVMWRVVVLVDDQKYTGNAEVHMNATKGIDKTSPFENAETSALGRALGFAGYGVVESVASADEVVIARSVEASQDYNAAVKRASNPVVTAPARATEQPEPAAATPQPTFKEMFAQGKQKGLWTDAAGFYKFGTQILDITVDGGATLTREQRAQLAAAIENAQSLSLAS